MLTPAEILLPISSRQPPVWPFSDLNAEIVSQSRLRELITAAYPEPETECASRLLQQARLNTPTANATEQMAIMLVEETQGFRYSYDMLGEAATTAEDAQRYYESYEKAIHAIRKASAGRGAYGSPGISIKLSALYPRYSRSWHSRMVAELLGHVRALALLAKR